MFYYYVLKKSVNKQNTFSLFFPGSFVSGSAWWNSWLRTGKQDRQTDIWLVDCKSVCALIGWMTTYDTLVDQSQMSELITNSVFALLNEEFYIESLKINADKSTCCINIISNLYSLIYNLKISFTSKKGWVKIQSSLKW